ncbi:MAG: tripartite tricarboxylate transporter TctB family protein [Syntrophales bacterium]
MNSKKQRLAVHGFWIALSVVICWSSSQLGMGSFQEPGPGFMPFIMGSLMFILTIASIFEKIPSAKERPPLSREIIFKLCLTIGSLWLYAFLLPVIGFIPDTLILMMFLFSVIQKVRWTTALLASVLSVAACYFLFSSLGAEFPKGFFS